jgi:hypothetical protein
MTVKVPKHGFLTPWDVTIEGIHRDVSNHQKLISYLTNEPSSYII